MSKQQWDMYRCQSKISQATLENHQKTPLCSYHVWNNGQFWPVYPKSAVLILKSFAKYTINLTLSLLAKSSKSRQRKKKYAGWEVVSIQAITLTNWTLTKKTMMKMKRVQLRPNSKKCSSQLINFKMPLWQLNHYHHQNKNPVPQISLKSKKKAHCTKKKLGWILRSRHLLSH